VDTKIVPSSGNGFVDLGRTDAARKKVKAKFAVVINRALEEKRFEKEVAASLLGCSQSELSELVSYKLRGFSIGRLMEFLTALNHDIEIGIFRRTQGRGRIEVREE
jgi:predicted XRE-type DNA-binding protein